MSRDLIIGVDAGTSVIKAVAFDLSGHQLDLAETPNSYEEASGGAVEQDMARTWRDTVRVLRMLGDRIERLAERVIAVAVTGQGDGTWLIDGTGEPVAPAWLWLDSRAGSIVEELAASATGTRYYRHTGCALNACLQSMQLVWLKRHAPEVLARASTAFHCKDWLYFKLTGERATDVTEGTFTFGDFRTRRYVDDVLDALGIADLQRLLPPMLDGSRTTHPMCRQAPPRPDLLQGTPIVLGFEDVVCTALGAGLYDPNRTVGCSILGSTGMHIRFIPDAAELQLGEPPSGYTMAFPVAGSVARMQSTMAATLNIDWIVDGAREAMALLGREVARKDVLLALDARVLEGRPGAALFHPYIHRAGERGPFVEPSARAMFIGLSTQVGFIDLLRAVYEGLALAARDCYAAIGGMPDEIRIAGGAARSRSLKAILPSVLNVPIRETARTEARAAGAAILAAVAMGVERDFAAAVGTWVDPLLGDRIAPEPALAALYDQLFPLYLETREAMPPIWRRLVAVRGRDSS